MYRYLFVVLIGFSLNSFAQLTEQETLAHRAQHLSDLMDTSKHILNSEEIEHFQGLDYFDFDPNYQVKAIFKKDKGPKFNMRTSTSRMAIYRRYGYFYFEIANQKCTLEVYQSPSLRKQKQYRDHLFLPFRDKTTGKETYGAGRFIELTIPESNEFILDFNTAFNPYCAYSPRFSCPIPPEVNTLTIDIRAGEKTPLGDH